MRLPTRTVSTVAIGLFVAVTATGLAQRRGTAPAAATVIPADATARIVAAARAAVAALDETGKAKVQFPFESPQKSKWSNLPSPMFQRDGIRLADLTAPQRAAVDTLLSTALSRDGELAKAADVMLVAAPPERAAENAEPPKSDSNVRERRDVVLVRLRANGL